MVAGRELATSALATHNGVTALFEGVRRIVLEKNDRIVLKFCEDVWYQFLEKNFPVGRHLLFYLYVPFSAFLCICALFSVAISVNMNFYIDQKVLFKRLDELYRLVPHLT